MVPPLDPVHSDQAAPARTRVVVIGGGIVGTSTAFFLARKGIPTLLCEKGEIGGEQSGRNWGWVRKMGRDPREMPLMLDAERIWHGLRELGVGDPGFRATGILYLADSDAALAQHQPWLQQVRDYQLDSRFIGGEEVARLLPGSTRRWAGALYTPSDGGAEPSRAAPAFAEAARRLGAGIITGCAVRGLETAAGRVAAVVTERGRIACDAVVLAAGTWSSLFCGNLGLRLPQLVVLGSVMRTAPMSGGPTLSLTGPGFGFRRRADGGYIVSQAGATISEIVPDTVRYLLDFLPAYWQQRRNLRVRLGRRFAEEWQRPRRWQLDEVTPFERTRVAEPMPSHQVLDDAGQNLAAAFPFFKNMAIVERWGGLIDVMPDAIPVISNVDSVGGLYLATGFSGHGFGIGPGAGQLAADLVAGDAPAVDPRPFKLSRFA